MKADKTLSIKVKSRTERRIMDEPEIEMMTAWNLKRIISALVIFLIIIILILIYFFSRLGDDSVTSSGEVNEPIIRLPSASKENIPEHKIPQNLSQDTFDPVASSAENATLLTPSTTNSTENTDTNIVTVIEKQLALEVPKSEVLNKHVTQARLAQWVKDKVPHGNVDLPLRVDDSKAEGFYYFTDINNLQGNKVYHEWLREGKSIYKRRFSIRSPRARMSTSKLFTYRTTGQWQVRLITAKGEVLHKIDFLVVSK